MFKLMWKQTPHGYKCIPSLQHEDIQMAVEHTMSNLHSHRFYFELVLVKLLPSYKSQTQSWVISYSVPIPLRVWGKIGTGVESGAAFL